jgi:hypothetical protein
VNVGDGFRAPRRMRPACRTLATSSLNAASFVEIPPVRFVSGSSPVRGSGRSLVLCVHEHLASKHKRSSR